MTVADTINTLFKGQNRLLAVQLLEITEALKQYAPFTVRQVYYQAVSRLYVSNELRNYKRVSEILTDLRRADVLPWSYIEDRTRRTTEKRGLANVSDFLQFHAEAAFNPKQYERCRVQKQSVYVELVIEKDALSAIVENIAYPYCTRVSIGRGQLSASMVQQIATRCDAALMKGLEPIILYLGDLDPSGVAIPKNLKNALYNSHDLEVSVTRIALNPEQVKRYNLPETVDAAKKTDTNFKAWRNEFGHQSPVELDALHPKDLQALVTESLCAVYDMNQFDDELRREEQERLFLKGVQADMQRFLKRQYPAEFAFL